MALHNLLKIAKLFGLLSIPLIFAVPTIDGKKEVYNLNKQKLRFLSFEEEKKKKNIQHLLEQEELKKQELLEQEKLKHNNLLMLKSYFSNEVNVEKAKKLRFKFEKMTKSRQEYYERDIVSVLKEHNFKVVFTGCCSCFYTDEHTVCYTAENFGECHYKPKYICVEIYHNDETNEYTYVYSPPILQNYNTKYFLKFVENLQRNIFYGDAK